MLVMVMVRVSTAVMLAYLGAGDVCGGDGVIIGSFRDRFIF